MKIALIRMNSPADEIIPPLSLGFLAARLRDRHDVEVLDCLLRKTGPDAMRSVGRTCDLAGITLFTKDIALCRKYLRELKAANPSVITVLGGPHASALPAETLDHFGGLCDYVLAGEAEEGLAALADGIAEGRLSPGTVAGLAYREGGNIRVNAPDHPEPLDDFGVAWDLIPPGSYPPAPHGAIFRQYPVAPIITSRGCPYGCLFCSGHTVTGKRIRRRSIASVMDEIDRLREAHGVREIHIEDDTFTSDRKYVLEFCREIRARFPGLTWACPNGVRIDTLDGAMLAAMKEAGCYALSFGLESGNDDVLSAMGKRLTARELRRAIGMVRDAGLDAIGFFILGFPGETRRHMETTIAFACSLPLTRATFATFQPFPGSPVFRQLADSGALTIGSWEAFSPNLQTTIWSPEGVSTRELALLRKKALLRFYLRPRVLWSLLGNIRGGGHLFYILKRAFRWLGSSARRRASSL
jgi:radical SAM superfamily enzyme YgiQ (UPF0313 family)